MESGARASTPVGCLYGLIWFFFWCCRVRGFFLGIYSASLCRLCVCRGQLLSIWGFGDMLSLCWVFTFSLFCLALACPFLLLLLLLLLLVFPAAPLTLRNGLFELVGTARQGRPFSVLAVVTVACFALLGGCLPRPPSSHTCNLFLVGGFLLRHIGVAFLRVPPPCFRALSSLGI